MEAYFLPGREMGTKPFFKGSLALSYMKKFFTIQQSVKMSKLYYTGENTVNKYKFQEHTSFTMWGPRSGVKSI